MNNRLSAQLMLGIDPITAITAKQCFTSNCFLDVSAAASTLSIMSLMDGCRVGKEWRRT